MKAPDKIYLCPFFSERDEQHKSLDDVDEDSVTFCWSRFQNEDSPDIEYIRKDALLEWAESEKEKCEDETHPYAMYMNVVIHKLNSL